MSPILMPILCAVLLPASSPLDSSVSTHHGCLVRLDLGRGRLGNTPAPLAGTIEGIRTVDEQLVNGLSYSGFLGWLSADKQFAAGVFFHGYRSSATNSAPITAAGFQSRPLEITSYEPSVSIFAMGLATVFRRRLSQSVWWNSEVGIGLAGSTNEYKEQLTSATSGADQSTIDSRKVNSDGVALHLSAGPDWLLASGNGIGARIGYLGCTVDGGEGADKGSDTPFVGEPDDVSHISISGGFRLAL